MSVKIRKGTALNSLSLTPLIDVVFLLLIFFLVATRFAQEDRELDVMLPDASEAQPLIAQPKQLWVNVDHDGAYFVDGKTLSGDELEHVLQQAAINNPANQAVIIRADKRVQLDHVVRVINLCYKFGISDHQLNTE